MAGGNPRNADRADLVVVAGGVTAQAAHGVERVIAHIMGALAGTVVMHHDLRAAGPGGVVRRRLRLGPADHTTVLGAAGCGVSRTLREDVLPLLRELGRRPQVRRIVLHLDPGLEPEPVCAAVLHEPLDGVPVTDAVRLRGVITVLDAGSWLADATGAQQVAERGLARLPDDERTLAQLVVGQAEFADLLVHAGTTHPGCRARTNAVLDRLAPLAPRLPLALLDRRVLLDELPPGARRGRPEAPYAALLRGQPPLHADGGVRLVTFTARRPFHPGRLHAAIDVLLDGVVRTRGRIWLATRPDAALWLESAGGGLQLGHLGDWLAAGDATAWQRVDPERQAAASLRWHDRWGDRAQELAILVHDADIEVIDGGLRDALLTDGEIAAGERTWRHFPDPFGSWHTDPCDQITPQPVPGRHQPGRHQTEES